MTDEIYQLLQSPDEDIRLKAVLELGTPSISEDITTLVDMLSDRNWRVRKAVVRVLAQADIKSIVPLLVKSLSRGTKGMTSPAPNEMSASGTASRASRSHERNARAERTYSRHTAPSTARRPVIASSGIAEASTTPDATTSVQR